MTKNNEITLFPSSDDLFKFAAKDFNRRAIASVYEKKTFSVVLSGGDTPKLFFDTLTSDKNYRDNTPWHYIKFFFGDERYVSSNNIKSNYHTAYEHLFSKVPVNKENIYQIPTMFNKPADAAKDYENTIRKVFSMTGNIFPQFDLIYLGLGSDGHTVSLMPFSDEVTRYTQSLSSNQSDQLVTSLFIEKDNMYRITLTPSIINNSQDIIFLVTGENKAVAVREVLEGQTNPIHYPAQLICRSKRKTIWYIDQAAAAKLTVL